MGIKIISRAVLIHNNSLLLVKNTGNNYWSLPGGHWEWDSESLKECVLRELKEETGLTGMVDNLLFTQEFQSGSSKVIEFIWSIQLEGDETVDTLSTIDHQDIDLESEIEKVEWFNLAKLGNIDIKPAIIREFLNKNGVTKIHFES